MGAVPSPNGQLWFLAMEDGSVEVYEQEAHLCTLQGGGRTSLDGRILLALGRQVPRGTSRTWSGLRRAPPYWYPAWRSCDSSMPGAASSCGATAASGTCASACGRRARCSA